MSQGSYRAVTEYPVTEYRCGVRAGDRVRLRRDLQILDEKDQPTGQIHVAGEVWTVLRGTAEEPPVIWLQQPDGHSHTWSDDEDFLHTFEIVR